MKRHASADSDPTFPIREQLLKFQRRAAARENVTPPALLHMGKCWRVDCCEKISPTVFHKSAFSFYLLKHVLKAPQ